MTYEGTTAIDGVPGTAAPIRLSFLDAAGAKTGRLLPTGRARDRILGSRSPASTWRCRWSSCAPPISARPATSAPAELDTDARPHGAAGSDPPRGRPAHGPGRCRRAGHPQARPGRRSPGRRHAGRALLHARAPATARSPPPVPSASPPPASRRAASPTRSPDRTAPARRRTVVIEHPAGRIPIELELAPAGADGPGPARLARPHRPAAVRRVGVRPRPPLNPPHQGACHVERRTLLAAALAAAHRRCRPGAVDGAAGRLPEPGRSACSCPTPPAAEPTRSPASSPRASPSKLGQQMVVENNGTAGGNVATAAGRQGRSRRLHACSWPTRARWPSTRICSRT